MDRYSNDVPCHFIKSLCGVNTNESYITKLVEKNVKHVQTYAADSFFFFYYKIKYCRFILEERHLIIGMFLTFVTLYNLHSVKKH